MKTLKQTLVLLSLTVFFLASCKKDDIDDLPEPDIAAFNVVNASPGQTSFNFALDNQIVNGPALTFTDQTGYISAYTGIRKFDVTLGGTTQSILTDTLNLETDKYYSLFITGQSPLSLLITEDDLTAPATGKAKIRFIQLSPNAGELALGVKGEEELFPEQEFKAVSAFISIDPAQYILEIKDDDGDALTESTVTIAAGKIYTVWAGGLLEGTGNSAMVIQVSVDN
ncbi:DUF4397 domain-containing protein [Pedobacter immunditicola]|uniref:DUF4397 domain-containing protein n=1 Tax=Pedobacter immunditicola TaxID=3133440 RepID=UPI0030B4F7E8